MERFAIDSATGEVTVAIPLDYETVTEPYVLTVIAEDSGELNAFSVHDTVIMWYIPVCVCNCRQYCLAWLVHTHP